MKADSKDGVSHYARLALRPGYHCCILPACSLPHNFSPPPFCLTETQTEYITLGPTRPHTPPLFILSLLVFPQYLTVHTQAKTHRGRVYDEAGAERKHKAEKGVTMGTRV